MKLVDLIKEYNNLIDQLPMHAEKPGKFNIKEIQKEMVLKPSKLDPKAKLNDLGFTDEFWELDTRFKSQEKWAVNPEVRKAIVARQHYSRAIEEIFILGGEVDRYYKWLVSRLDGCEPLLAVVDVNSAIGYEFLKTGLKTADALQRLGGLTNVLEKLACEETFASVREKIKCNLSYLLC